MQMLAGGLVDKFTAEGEVELHASILEKFKFQDISNQTNASMNMQTLIIVK